jgi:hyaluronan synthase
VHNFELYWYQPWVNFYSLTVGVFILSRFLLAAFYHPPVDAGFEPTVSVVVAGMNEEDSIDKTIGRIYSEGYPHEKLEVIVINDGSTDGTLSEMLKAQGRHRNLVVVDFEKNKGKRHGMAAGALLARGEFLVYVDSDSFLMPGSIYKVLQGLADPTVAAVAGHTDVENADVNILTRMQDLRYFVSYRIMKGAEHIFGAVSCCPGCFSAYRKSVVLNVLNQWLYQRFLGTYCTYGDDRGLTNYILRHYRVLYDDQALATTIVPEKWKKYITQQARWKRSWVREFFFAGRFFWKKHPVAAISWYAMTLLPLLAPLVMFNALILGPLLYGRPAGFYVGGVLVVTLLWSLYYLEKTGRPGWWTGFIFILTYIGFFSWQGYYSLATVRVTKWGTR